MPCFHPRTMYSDGAGGWSMTERPPFTFKAVRFRCNDCDGCRGDRRAEWGMRGYHEARGVGVDNCAFVTLTYDNDHLPLHTDLEPAAISDFMRRLRKIREREAKREGRAKPLIRYFGCGEYGDSTRRPHYHVNLFGEWFPDREFFKRSRSGESLFTSALLSRVWPYGHAVFGAVTPKSALYVAGYVMKGGNGKESRRRRIVMENGVPFERSPEYAAMSTHPGIGAGFFERFSGDFFPHDYAVLDGRKLKVPRYYEKLYRRMSRECRGELDELKAQREFKAQRRAADNTDERLAVREKCARARIARWSKEGV